MGAGRAHAHHRPLRLSLATFAPPPHPGPLCRLALAWHRLQEGRRCPLHGQVATRSLQVPTPDPPMMMRKSLPPIRKTGRVDGQILPARPRWGEASLAVAQGGSRTRVGGGGEGDPGRRPDAPSALRTRGPAAPAMRLASPRPLPLPSGFSSIGPARRAPAPNLLWAEGSSLPTSYKRGALRPGLLSVSGPPTAKPILLARKGRSEGNSWAACACALMGVIISPALHPETRAVYIIYGGLGLRIQAGRPPLTVERMWENGKAPRGAPARSCHPDLAPPPCSWGS